MLNRRRFLKAFGLTAAGGVAVRSYPANWNGGGSALLARLGTKNSKTYGSGYFGEWIKDEFGLPAYRYTCDQTRDPKARTPVNPEWRSPTDHTHQVGNDRLVAAVSNYGYVQVRQDEGAPKFLNDYSPARGQYGGGIGYLTDGSEVLSTFYTGNNKTFERIFGTGYLRKKVAGADYAVDQVIFAPFGDDPLLVSQVTVTNRGKAPRNLRWVEYWGCQVYQFSYRAFIQAAFQGDPKKAAELRRKFGERFAHQFRILDGNVGLLEAKRFLGRTPEDEPAWKAAQAALAANPNTFFGGPVKEPAKGAAMEDLNPPPTFLLSLDAPADAFATDGKAFFGVGGVERPAGLASALDGSLAATGPESALLLERRMHLRPGESRTLYFAYGYLTDAFELNSLIEKYRKDLSVVWSRSSAAWKDDGVRLRVDFESWVERELTWHNYYLRSNLTYDSFFREHILSQGHVYQYIMGFQGAARDPLQHALPFVFSHPETVKQVLRYTLKEIQPDGTIPYGIVGHGMPMPAIYRPSDQEMWLLWLASEYVLATRDTAFLQEEVPTYAPEGLTAGKETVRQLLARCYRHLVEDIGTGEHGLMRLSNGDWNDNVVVGHVPPALYGEVHRHAESVLNAAMASYVLDHYARLLNYNGQADLAATARRTAEAQRQAVRAQWAGRWFRRAWLTPELGWVGEDQVWLEPQPWAIIGGATTPEQARELVQALDALVRQPSPIGAMLHSKGVAKMNLKIGIGTNGGVWPSINGTLIWALAKANGELAWDEWKKNSLARHAEAYPEIWYGIWSGPDTYNSTLSQTPGQTMLGEAFGVNWTDYPVMNMHPHAWPLYTVAKLLGVEFREKGVVLAPTLPLDAYEFNSPLLGMKKSSGKYAGWYAPSGTGVWTITLRLPAQEAARLKRAEVNGVRQAPRRTPDGAIEFEGQCAPGSALRWSIWS